MTIPVVALYAALLALIGLTLQAMVGRTRLPTGVPLNDGGYPELAVAIRRHANFIEHVPMALILLVIIELNGAPAWLLHALGSVLVAARLVHPFGIKHDQMAHPARGWGALATLLVTLTAAVVAAWQLFAA